MRAKENIKLFYGGLLIFWIISIKINAQTADSMLNMSLEELMNIKVVTASNISEQLSKAPANVIVIDKNDIQLRGYTCMSDIFDDLPGMDISKPLGFQRVRNSMRGYRTSFGDSYLFMVDGIVFNQLWYNEATAQSAVPISNVERVEIVYGPASSVYGANAFMGVINVITKKDDQKDGVSANLISNFGKNAYNGDYSLFYKKEDFRMSIATRFENWNLFDRIDNTKYRWTNTSLLTDRSLWGGLVDNTQLTSPPAINNRGVDLRTYYKTTELGFHYYQTDQGYGMIFPYDKSLASQQPMSDYSVYLRLVIGIDEPALGGDPFFDAFYRKLFIIQKPAYLQNQIDFIFGIQTLTFGALFGA